MAELSGFFDAYSYINEDGDTVYDRTYLAENFAKYFASFVGNGVFGGKSNELMVRQKNTADMSVNVLSGQGWINGYWYENTDELSMAIDIADGVLNRIDLIVLRWDNSERIIRLAIKKGVPATIASAPGLQRNADYYELKLAQIFIKAGATRITQADITDTRLNPDMCGLVVGILNNPDVDSFGIQLETYVNEFITEYNLLKKQTSDEIEAWKTQTKNSYNTWFTQFKADSQASFNTFLSTNQAKVDKLLSDGQTSVDNLIETGETNLAKVASDGQTAINGVVSTGTTSINNLIATKRSEIDKIISDTNAELARLESEINSLLESGENDVNNLISQKTAEIDALITSSQKRFNDAILALEKIASENEVASLVLDVQALNDLFKESGPNPGCFYRVASTGENEWINPPNEVGISYRTSERWNGKPVYQKLFYIGALPNKTYMYFNVDARFDRIISISGFAIDSDNNLHYEFPIIINGLSPVAVIQSAEGDGGEGSGITIQTNEDLSNFIGYITVKYVKE